MYSINFLNSSIYLFLNKTLLSFAVCPWYLFWNSILPVQNFVEVLHLLILWFLNCNIFKFWFSFFWLISVVFPSCHFQSAFTRSKHQNQFCSKLLFGFQDLILYFQCLFFFFLYLLCFPDTITAVQLFIIFDLLRSKSLQARFHIPDCPPKIISRHIKYILFLI